MTTSNYEQGKLDRITRKWWFFLLFVLLQFIPPYASKGYKFPEEWVDVLMHAAPYAFIYSYAQLFPLFKIIPIALIVLIIIFKNKVGRLFNLYVAFSYMLFAFGQNIAVTEKYGVTIDTTCIVMFFVVACFWIWEAIVKQNNFNLTRLAIWRYWVVPLALFVFWGPVNFETFKPDFNPLFLFTNVVGVAFCGMTPVYVALLTLYWPKVNIATLRVTSLVGFIISLYQMHLSFYVMPSILWWSGVLHIPLLVISLYGLILSLKHPYVEQQTNERNASAKE